MSKMVYETTKDEKYALLEEIKQEIIEINGLFDVLNTDIDGLLELVEINGPLRKSVVTTSETFRDLIAEFKKFNIVPCLKI